MFPFLEHVDDVTTNVAIVDQTLPFLQGGSGSRILACGNASHGKAFNCHKELTEHSHPVLCFYHSRLVHVMSSVSNPCYIINNT